MYTKIKEGISWLLLALVFVILIFSVALFWPAMKRSSETREELEITKAKLAARKAERIALLREVHDLEHNPAAIEKVGREKFNLCREGEVIIKYDQEP